MAKIIVLETRRNDISSVLKQRAALQNFLWGAERDTTADELARLAELEDKIAYGTPRTAAEARAQDAFGRELVFALALPFFGAGRDLWKRIDRSNAACASAEAFFSRAA